MKSESRLLFGLWVYIIIEEGIIRERMNKVLFIGIWQQTKLTKMSNIIISQSSLPYDHN